MIYRDGLMPGAGADPHTEQPMPAHLLRCGTDHCTKGKSQIPIILKHLVSLSEYLSFYRAFSGLSVESNDGFEFDIPHM